MNAEITIEGKEGRISIAVGFDARGEPFVKEAKEVPVRVIKVRLSRPKKVKTHPVRPPNLRRNTPKQGKKDRFGYYKLTGKTLIDHVKDYISENGIPTDKEAFSQMDKADLISQKILDDNPEIRAFKSKKRLRNMVQPILSCIMRGKYGSKVQ